MIRRLAPWTLALFFAAMPAFAQEDVLQRIAEEQGRQRQAVRTWLERTRMLEAKPPSGFVATVLGDSNPDYQRYRRELDRHYQQLSAAESALRETFAAELIARTQGMSDEQREQLLYARAQEAETAFRRRTGELRNSLAQGLASVSGTEQRARTFAEIEALLRTARLEHEMTAAASQRVRPVIPGSSGSGDPTMVGATTARMRKLMDEATSIDTEIGRGEIADGNVREAERWMRAYRRDAAIDEYRRIARGGTIVDPGTGRPISGTLRQTIARDSERALAEQLRKRSLQSSRYDILRFLASDDARTGEAERIEADLAATPEYRALDFLNPSASEDTSGYFRALAHSVRLQEQDVDKWRTDFVPSSKFTTGAATAHRIAGNAGEMSLSQVDARIARYHREADAVVSAFSTAADKPPSALSPEQRQLLRNYGYVVGEPGDERYAIPAGGQRLSGLRSNLNLPGAHLLDMISAANVAKTVATTVAPTMAAGRVGYLLRGLTGSERAVVAGMTAADMVVGLGADAAFEFAETGKVDNVGRKVIDATLLRAGGNLVGSASNALAGPIAARLTRDPKLREKVAARVAEALGLPSDAALQAYYQGQVQGTGMTYESFLSNMLSGTISRAAAAAQEGYDGTLPKWVDKRLPSWLKAEVAADPTLGRELFDRDKAIAERYSAAERKFRAVVGEDVFNGRIPAADSPSGLDGTSSLAHDALTREQLANRLTHALESGQVTWAELKMLYAQRPDLEPVMSTINARRTQIFGGIVNKAQELARADLAAEHKAREERLREALKDDPQQLGKALFENNAWHAAELANINQRLIIPGSTNLTSDIDRSSRSEFVRKHLRALYDRRTAGFERPATSAQAWDVNEYIDVAPAMGKILSASRDIAGEPAGSEYLGLRHGEAVEANAMASAQLHMMPAQRQQYRANVLKGAKSEDARQLLQRQLNAADLSLARGEEALKNEMARLTQEDPRLAGTTDLETRARDSLYARRTEAIRSKTAEIETIDQRLRTLPADSPEARQLTKSRNEKLAQIHREWGVALREGIETYASLENLDVVLGDAQFPDIKVRQLINDQNYTRAGLAKDGRELTDGQVRNMLNDQIMMMTHHMNGYHEGHEGTIDAASAVGKYAERAVLALKLQGADLGKEPYKALSEASEKLVKARKDPQALRKELERLGNGDADAGLEALSRMVMAAVPETAGMFAPEMATGEHAAGRSDGRAMRARILRERELERQRERTLALEGPMSARAENAAELPDVEAELAGLRREKARRDRLGSRYVRQDWPKAEALEAEAEQITARLAQLDHLGIGGGVERGKLEARRAEIARELDGYNQSFRAAGGNKPTADDARLANRIAALEEEKGLRERADSVLERAVIDEETALGRMRPFEDGVTPFGSNPPIVAKPGTTLRASLLGGQAEIEIR